MIKNQDLSQEVSPKKPEEALDAPEISQAAPVEKPKALEKEKNPDQAGQDKLRQEIENMDVDDSSKAQVAASAQDVVTLEEKEKIKKLLQMAKTKGVVYAVAVAKTMNDPFVLDTLHDALAKEGYYKQFVR